jgi:hypothetical protein
MQHCMPATLLPQLACPEGYAKKGSRSRQGSCRLLCCHSSLLSVLLLCRLTVLLLLCLQSIVPAVTTQQYMKQRCGSTEYNSP